MHPSLPSGTAFPGFSLPRRQHTEETTCRAATVGIKMAHLRGHRICGNNHIDTVIAGRS
jgi:hypothetical protein